MKKFYFLTLALICAIVTNAASIPGGTKLYLTPNSNWLEASARFAVYFWNNSGNTWKSMTAVSGETNLYEVEVPAGTWDNLIFCRMNPSNTTNSWDTKWNQTADLTYDGTNNHYTVKSGTWDNGGGTWSYYGVTEDVILSVNITPDAVYPGDVVSISVTAKNQPTGSIIQIDVDGEVTEGTTATWTATEAGSYTVKVTCLSSTKDELASSESIIKVYKKDSVFITGSFTKAQWNPEEAEEFIYLADQDHYYYFVSSASAVEFKLSTKQGNWDAFNGSNIYNSLAAADTEYSYTNNPEPNMKLPAGEWYIIVNTTTKKIQYTADDKLTGIEEIGIDDVPAVYYNLQGVKVANPENGIFIKRQGSKATKVVL
ncbi:MAG: hypothetical protein IJ328_02385 [Muribaculaceae bacterium]|nr:hypothetical protein [Muribaculaceae bacterium]